VFLSRLVTRLTGSGRIEGESSATFAIAAPILAS